MRIPGRWVARPDNQGSPEAPPDVMPAMELDHNQANVVLAALEDAAALRREAIGYCPDCRSADNRVCPDHAGSWETAEKYDWLRWHLDNPCRDGEPDQADGAATIRTPTRHADPVRPAVDHDRGGWDGRAPAAPQPAGAERLREAQPGPGPARSQIFGRIEANGYEPDREAGE